MNRDQMVGWGLVAVSITVIIAYSWLMLTDMWQILARLTLIIAIIAVFGILAWIGYTLATTPPPKPVEEIEKEIEEELKKLEQEIKQEKK